MGATSLQLYFKLISCLKANLIIDYGVIIPDNMCKSFGTWPQQNTSKQEP